MSKNDITGNEIKSKVGNLEAFGTGYDAIFRKTDSSILKLVTQVERQGGGSTDKPTLIIPMGPAPDGLV